MTTNFMQKLIQAQSKSSLMQRSENLSKAFVPNSLQAPPWKQKITVDRILRVNKKVAYSSRYQFGSSTIGV